MDTFKEPYWPSVWEVVRIVAALAVITVIGAITRNDVIAAFAALLIFGGMLAWWFLRYWR